MGASSRNNSGAAQSTGAADQKDPEMLKPFDHVEDKRSSGTICPWACSTGRSRKSSSPRIAAQPW